MWTWSKYCGKYCVHRQWGLNFKGRMLDVSNAMHACTFSALTVLGVAGNPNKPIVGPTTRPGIHHEQWCHDPVSILFMSWLDLWGSAEGSDWQDTVDHCLRLKCKAHSGSAIVNLLAVFVEVWHIWYCFAVVDWHIQDSGRWVIYGSPQVFLMFIVKAVGGYYSQLCLRLRYQRCSILHKFTGSLKGSMPYSLVLIFFLSVQT